MKKPIWAEIINRNIVKVTFNEPVRLGEDLNMGLNIDGKKVDYIIAMKDYMSQKVDIVLREKLNEDDVSKDIELKVGENSLKVVPTKVLDEFVPDEKLTLGYVFYDNRIVFRLWSPVAKKVSLLLFKDYNSHEPDFIFPMERKGKGVWEIETGRDFEGYFYLYEIERLGKIVRTVDIYSKSTSINGEKSAIIDLSKTDPEGWENDRFIKLSSFTEAIVYEIHIADISIFDENIPDSLRGKYLGLTYGSDLKDLETSIFHLKALGVTHVQIMPIMIFRSCDEDKEGCYNWGYDPYLYMVPSGKYSTDPYDPYKRVYELKKLIKILHENGIGVILDIVFPHTYEVGEKSPLDATVPYYFYKMDDHGNYVDLTACGNTTDSKKYMMRKLMIDTIKYWISEYHIDGFRFDQMGVIDLYTMEKIVQEGRKINPSLLIYGEPWGGGNSVEITKGKQKGKGFGVFNDDIRDAIRGSVFDVEKRGFVMAERGQEKRLAISIVGSPVYLGGFAEFPFETINYAECHDNHTLFDKNYLASKLDTSYEWTIEELKKAQKLAGAIILTSLGIPFLHLGQDFCRTKKFNPNSYNASVEINGIDWKRKTEYKDVYKYYQGLIKLRRQHKAFQANDPVEIRLKTKILKASDLFVVVYYGENLNEDEWKHILLFYNGSLEEKKYHLPFGKWHVVVDDKSAGVDTLWEVKDFVKIPPLSAYVMWG